MNEEKFNTGVEKTWSQRRSRNGNVWTGVFLLLIGGLLLANKAGVNFPHWFFSWPMILITIGLFSGLRHRFRRGPWFILLLVGGVFLADKISDDLQLRPYFWPIIFIAAGIYIIFGPQFNARKRRNAIEGNALPANTNAEPGFVQPYDTKQFSSSWDRAVGDSNEVIDITAVFSGVKKNVLSKNFHGGDIVAIMGGAEVNLTKADFKGRISIDNFTMFGGTKLIVPPDWDVQSQVVAIFGGVDDKRPPSAQHDPSKVIYLEGTCIFGGIEIRSY